MDKRLVLQRNVGSSFFLCGLVGLSGEFHSPQNNEINRLKPSKNALFKPFSRGTIRPKWLFKGKIPPDCLSGVFG